MKTVVTLSLVSLMALGCSSTQTSPDGVTSGGKSGVQILPTSDVKWEQLNPARGDKSPQAGTLWGNRKGSNSTKTEYHAGCPICEWEQREGAVATGFLAKFIDGFSSPPHIHNVTYRAVVISGLVHNDDPDAAEMWMPTGSFWTQPKGEVHITSAKGDDVMALVEIDKGPYLVLPPDKAFDSGERPVNVDVSNLVWVDAPGSHAHSKKEKGAKGVKIAYLWGNLKDGESNGTFLKLPAGFKGAIHSQGDTFRGVVIQGVLKYQGRELKPLEQGQEQEPELEPGSYFGSSGDNIHPLFVKPGEACTIYIRTNGKYEVRAN